MTDNQLLRELLIGGLVRGLAVQGPRHHSTGNCRQEDGEDQRDVIHGHYLRSIFKANLKLLAAAAPISPARIQTIQVLP